MSWQVVKQGYCQTHFANRYPQEACGASCRAPGCLGRQNRPRRAVRRGYCLEHFAEQFPQEHAEQAAARACYVCGPPKASQRLDAKTKLHFCKPCFALHAASPRQFCYYCQAGVEDVVVRPCGSDKTVCSESVQICGQCSTVRVRPLCMACFHIAWAETCWSCEGPRHNPNSEEPKGKFCAPCGLLRLSSSAASGCFFRRLTSDDVLERPCTHRPDFCVRRVKTCDVCAALQCHVACSACYIEAILLSLRGS